MDSGPFVAPRLYLSSSGDLLAVAGKQRWSSMMQVHWNITGLYLACDCIAREVMLIRCMTLKSDDTDQCSALLLSKPNLSRVLRSPSKVQVSAVASEADNECPLNLGA